VKIVAVKTTGINKKKKLAPLAPASFLNPE
jgi:hypothetical protein